MDNCIQNTTACIVEGVGIFIYFPTTTTTTIDPLCYLVDCEGNYIVDCQCNNIVGCGCVTSSTTTTISPFTTTSTSTSIYVGQDFVASDFESQDFAV